MTDAGGGHGRAHFRRHAVSFELTITVPNESNAPPIGFEQDNFYHNQLTNDAARLALEARLQIGVQELVEEVLARFAAD